MKKILSILIALLLISAGAFAEESATQSPAPTEESADVAGAVYSLYDFEGETMDIETAYWVSFDDNFKMEMPAGWQNYALTDIQTEKGMIACFGDGTHFMFIGREDDIGAYEDMSEFGMTLALNTNYVSIFLDSFNETEFICYRDYENSSSDCATIISGKGIYTFYFYPVDNDTDFAMTVLNLMNSYTTMEVENGDE